LIVTRPATATTIFHLPGEFACAWSPGVDLHVKGSGETYDEATVSLVKHLRDLAQQLLDEADKIEQDAQPY